MKTIEFDETCTACSGTGLYIGMGERSGAAVVCHNCKGTGCHHFKHTYDPFTERFETYTVKRVYQSNPGICIGEGNGHTLESFGGLNFEDWKAGAEFTPGTENRKSTCPAWWYQGVDYDKKPKWDGCRGCGAFSGCKNFPEKETCWERWDKEFGA